jgi:3-deoxy-D-manno-octulosonate 8-phosphate phosphatase (KDO 8-P phosphatase)
MADFSKFKQIDTFIFDVDGVLTNSKLLITEKGELLRTMNVRDGQAIKMALNKGYKIGIITKGASSGVKIRLEVLGIQYIMDKVLDKMDALNQLIEKGFDPSTSLYMGDDVPDLALLGKVKIFTCPYDASPEVLTKSEYISSQNGGEGCVRELIQKVLSIQDNWM